ncbi:hypothetical protein Patl1_13043 [Pistacia atlantica]|uniref:Uncharacterized protein n=1 Tax=Pistacia atlantica TaxID=434234 RepID=A0ACC1AXM3_9ROSI|nr:hypothetical protein Patl1_13043 [Pistacia atlantica]
MIKGFVVEENMSHLTCTSGEVSASSSSRVETGTMYTQASTDQAPTTKEEEKSSGKPRFICEICNKGFQRDQNLQLHRRGHNLPWKLKQKSNKVERRKVYVCPEPTCVHNDPSRALGDLTGIKKHFSRKHGEKKWNCEKCSKRYAVQSDWKAHSKICGTREYRCDCGKLFSRRDSFITHRAFCDVLAEESARAITTNPFLSSQQPNSLASNFLNLPPQLQTHGLQPPSVKREQDQHHIFNPRPNNNSVPPWLACPQGTLAAGPVSDKFPTHVRNCSSAKSGRNGRDHEQILSAIPQPCLDPTKLTCMKTLVPHLQLFGACDAATGAGGGASPSLLHDMMSCLSSASGFDEGLNGYHNLHETFSRTTEPRLSQNDQ